MGEVSLVEPPLATAPMIGATLSLTVVMDTDTPSFDPGSCVSTVIA